MNGDAGEEKKKKVDGVKDEGLMYSRNELAKLRCRGWQRLNYDNVSERERKKKRCTVKERKRILLMGKFRRRTRAARIRGGRKLRPR